MIITIQPLKKGYAIITSDDPLIFPEATLQNATRIAGLLSDVHFTNHHERPRIKILPMERTPVMRVNPGFIKAVDNFINSNTPMATKKTYPAKKKAVVKKVVKKGKKK